MARNRRGLRLSSRDLNRLVTLRFPVSTPVEVAPGVPLPGHTNESYRDEQVFAGRMAGGGGEAIAEGRVDARDETRWVIDYRNDVTTDCLLVEDNGVEWNVRNTSEMGKRCYLELRCVRAGR